VAEHRHKRDTDARRKPRAVLVAGPLALLATASAVVVGMAAHEPEPRELTADHGVAADLSGVRDRVTVSRSQDRMQAEEIEPKVDRTALREAAERKATVTAVRNADSKLWSTTLLNLWSDATASATQFGTLEAGKHVLVTGRQADGREEIVVDGQSRWVTSGYLTADKPEPEPTAPAGLSTAPCPDSGVESGLTSSAISVYRSVCHAFPQITSYGGWDAHGEHSSGRALDIMTSDKALGDQIAAYLQSHASELDLYDIIWWDQIWTPERAAEGWRDYGDHGSATANHMDHVHVATNG